jgi:hypothetical protein
LDVKSLDIDLANGSVGIELRISSKVAIGDPSIITPSSSKVRRTRKPPIVWRMLRNGEIGGSRTNCEIGSASGTLRQPARWRQKVADTAGIEPVGENAREGGVRDARRNE